MAAYRRRMIWLSMLILAVLLWGARARDFTPTSASTESAPTGSVSIESTSAEPERPLAAAEAPVSAPPNQAPLKSGPATPTQTPAPLPPLLVSSHPASGATWRGRPVTFVFDQPLDVASVDGLTVAPGIKGDVAVVDNRLVFTPGEAPQPTTRYTFTLDGNVRSVDGVPLGGILAVTLVAPAPFQVASTQPGDGSRDVSTDTPLVVVFNKPVVPLTGVEEQADLPVPLTIEPAVDGVGAWLNTSVFRFTPREGLAGATAYTVRVDGITSLEGEPLAEPVTFRFTTAGPVVLRSSPQGKAVRPESEITVLFSQPMDRESTETAFVLAPQTEGPPGAPVSGALTWNETGDQLTFTPDEPLAYGEHYAVTISTEARSARGQAPLRSPYAALFSVVPLPGVLTTRPADGQEGVSPDTAVSVQFRGAISPTTVLENVSIAPPITRTIVYSYYSPYDQRLVLQWAMEPRTRYTVTLGAAIADEYGNSLGQDYAFSFTTGDSSPFVRLNLPQFTHFSAFTDTVVSVDYRNQASLEVALYDLPQEQFMRLIGPNRWRIWQRYRIPGASAHTIWRRTLETTAALNQNGQEHIPLVDADGQRLPPGLYLLEVKLPPSRDENADTHARAVIVLSNDNLIVKKTFQGESLAWQTDLRTGQPVEGAHVRFVQPGKVPGEVRTGQEVGRAVTDADGIAAAQLSLDRGRSWLGLVALSGAPGDDHFAVAFTDWNEGISPWQFDISLDYDLQQVRSAFYTERPIYRPGQTVYWKGIVRLLQNDAFQLPPVGLPVQVLIRDDRGNTVLEQRYQLNQHGTVNGELALSEEATTGYYSLEARIDPDRERPIYAGTSFQVAEYRPPEFEIRVQSEQPETIQGDTITVTVEARYFSGGALANAPVTWRLLAEPYNFRWAGAPQGRYYSFMPVDVEDAQANPFGGFDGGLLQEGRGVTDAEGRLAITLPADLAAATSSQRWTFDVTVQSPSNQFVSGRTSVVVHRSAFYIGISPRQYVGKAGQEMAFDVVTVTPEGEPHPEAALRAIVYDYRWNSVYEKGSDGRYYWSVNVERTPVYTTSVTTGGDGMGELAWTPQEGGQYLVTLAGEDADGNPTRSAVYVWVSAARAEAFVPWRRENNDRMELVADKDLYRPGDTAQVLVPSPFTGPVYALLTVERGGIRERSVRVLESNSEVLEIPITSDYIPNVYVSVVLVKGVDATNPTPAMRLGYVTLPVDAAEKELAIAIEPSVAPAKPGQTVAYTLTVRNRAGEPVADAELSVALVDKGVLSLATGDARSLLDRFYYQQPLGVATGALLVINRDRLSQQLSQGSKGGGGGGPGSALTLRQNFADLAYWQADLTTDANGVATFSVTLPDNLTTWRLVARAVSDETLVGDAAHDLIATKELLIRPILPRFFTGGDRAQIGALVQNTTGESMGSVTLTADIRGAHFIDGNEPVTVTLDANGQYRLTRLIEVDGRASTVVVTFTAVATSPPALRGRPSQSGGGGLSDAVRISLPVHRYETPEVVGTSGTVPAEGRLEAIRLPRDASQNGELTVRVEASLAAGMLEGLKYLKHFPYECVEQTVSRFLPNLFTALAMQRLGVDNPDLEVDLAFQIGVGLQRLVNRQNPDGGWGWWSGMQSNRYITSYVLWGLWTADQAGYPVPERVIEDGLFFLEQSWQAPADTIDTWKLNQMAFAHFVLAEMGVGDPGRMSTLYAERERLDLYGQAFLAMAMAKVAEADGAEDARVQTLLDDLMGRIDASATGAHWEEERIDWWSMNTDTRTTAIGLYAFSRLRPDAPLLPNVVRWLMTARQADRWETTQENAWAIIALTEWMAATGELKADYDWQVTLNGEELGRGAFDRDNLNEPVTLRAALGDLLRDRPNALGLSRSNASGQMYYTTHLRYFLDATAVPARDRGLVVSRVMAAADGAHAGQPVSTVQVGDVVSVTVTLVAPTSVNYLVLEVPVPAGTEIIDTRLATTSEQFSGPQFGPSAAPGREGAGRRFWWRYWIPSHTDIRDEKVALFADYLPAGTYEYTFLVRATLPGEYRVLPAHAELMYFPEVWGRSAGALFMVTE